MSLMFSSELAIAGGTNSSEKLIVIAIDNHTDQLIQSILPGLTSEFASLSAKHWSLELCATSQAGAKASWARLLSSTYTNQTDNVLDGFSAENRHASANLFHVFRAQRPEGFSLAVGNSFTPSLVLAKQGGAFDHISHLDMPKPKAVITLLTEAIEDNHVDFGLLLGQFELTSVSFRALNMQMSALIRSLQRSQKWQNSRIAIVSMPKQAEQCTGELLLLEAQPEKYAPDEYGQRINLVDVAPSLACFLDLSIPDTWQGRADVVLSTCKPDIIVPHIDALLHYRKASGSDPQRYFVFTQIWATQFRFTPLSNTFKAETTEPGPVPAYSYFYDIKFAPDAALYRRFRGDEKAYFFHGRNYYRYGLKSRAIGKTYPRDIARWRVPKHWLKIDAAFNTQTSPKMLAYLFNGDEVMGIYLGEVNALPITKVSEVFIGWQDGIRVDAATAIKDKQGALFAYLVNQSRIYIFKATDEHALQYNLWSGPHQIKPTAMGNFRGLQTRNYADPVFVPIAH
ncbi:hypothetical protein L1285_14210 [Pseudoalteromonas sp. DL2-H2.2]|uniref:hypothetical protein n=1 Tax=Pseudoalteromonas sp. DL2-H2.2 TaxID=2908889 RepID=UPI001F256A7C|nr:hypothetical protein [Pseudoalteromonas sp. DL2-H2.2]MCF2909475.1 hypothetical protein [Pseudoalteromonas sp. DL2-H2.2]